MEQVRTRAILVSVVIDNAYFDDFEELTLLAQTADYEVVGTMMQNRFRADKAYFIGSGKLEELKQAVLELEADTVIFDNDINGSQFYNLEKFLEIEVIDRATLILEIFARHATSNEGKLQVELARKKHGLPRAMGQGLVLSRQGGGGGGGGGARRGGGEQKLELDKRTIREEIKVLEERIKKLTQERRLRREKRIQNQIKIVSIIGYTNAGKSTLMNYLTKAGVLVQDKLFATLDPISRKLWLAPNKEFLLVDTVGFISRLPHEFVDAFKSTLEETQYADLILHVVNGDSKDIIKEFDVVIEVLKSLNADKIPTITVLNKCDIADNNLLPDKENVVEISAKTGEGIPLLKEKICLSLFGEDLPWQ